MDEKVLEEIQFHQETISRDGASTSPLHLIREKEMEISGRVLASKREAEELIATARRKTVEMTTKAEDEGAKLAAQRATALTAEAEVEVERIRQEATEEVTRLRESISSREERAVAFLLDLVKSV
ncbi:MAG: hypothetical protein IBX62_09550 [Coriobacteriia bacterium]|nr:hypothetical protein [Coriobacteriia bacterium]